MSTRHDLETEQGRAAYRAELRGVGRPYRLAGLVLILIGAAITWMAQPDGALPSGVQPLGYGALLLGWGLIIAAVMIRTRHHRRHLEEGL